LSKLSPSAALYSAISLSKVFCIPSRYFCSSVSNSVSETPKIFVASSLTFWSWTISAFSVVVNCS